MTSQLRPLLCLWHTGSPEPEQIAAWKEALPPGARIVLASPSPCGAVEWIACDGQPLSALRLASQAYPDRDIALGQLAKPPAEACWLELSNTADANPQIDVISVDDRATEHTDGNAITGSSRSPTSAQPSSRWSPQLSYWRAAALRDSTVLNLECLPKSLRGALLGFALDPQQDLPAPLIAAPISRKRRRGFDLLAGARFAWSRSTSALHRTGSSLRQRGLRNTIQRVLLELRTPSASEKALLRIPKSRAFEPFSLPCAAAPIVSIVVPVYNHFDHTLMCLRALNDCGDATLFETIVIDDASTDETAARMAQVSGVRYCRNERNTGFIGACNAGAAIARGTFLVFLNNDTAVQPGWLDALIATFAEHPKVGLVGSKLVYPDGRLQEAGGVIFNDGSAWNYGRFESTSAAAYNYVRDADYCSGAAIALRRDLFEKFSGFDSLYAPAYYEDTDLAMKVRAEGLRVLYQPASTVVHFEGISSGTDTHSGVKAYQAVNRQKFVERWRDTLASYPSPGGDLRRVCHHRAKKRVLVIDAYTPMPDRDSGSLRLVNLMQVLREEGCAVDFFAANLQYDVGYSEALQQSGVQVWWKPWIRNTPSWFARHGPLFDMIVVSRHYIASSFIELARRHAPQARFVFDTVDLHYLREQREAEISDDAVHIRAAQQTRNRELKLIRSADVTLVVSPVEKALLAQEVPGARVEVVSNVHRPVESITGFDDRCGIAFVGSYRHPPNIDGARWLALGIFPLIRERRPDIVLHLIGNAPTDEILALGELPGVQVHGYVPDLDPYMDGCRVGLAPLRWGAGVKGKVNLSMAHGQPVVATPAAVEGMHLRDGIDVLVGSDTQTFADAVLRLYDDRALWQTLSENGIENIRRHFSFDAARAAMRRVLA